MEARAGPASAPISPSEILLAAAIVLWAAVILLRNDPGGLFVDPDSYMHLSRFRDGNSIFHGGYLLRDNAPYGTVLPWTVPFDSALALFYAIGRAFTDSSGALYFAARIVSPFFCLTIGPLMFFGLRPFFSLRARVVIAGLAATAPTLIFYSLPGDADHHAMEVWLSVLFAVTLIRYLFLDRPRYWHAAAAGIAAAVGLWANLEELIVIGTGLSALVLHRCLVERPRASAMRANDLVFGSAFAITLTAAWLVDRPYDGLWAPDIDRLSIVYVSFAWLFSAALVGVDAYVSRRAMFSHTRNLAVAALLGGTAFLAWVAIEPDVLGGPFGRVDQVVWRILIDENIEMQPLWRLNIATATASIILILIWISFAILIAKTSGAQRQLWIACAVLMIPISLLGIRYYRSVHFAEVLGSIPLGVVLAYRTRQYPKYIGYSAVAMSTGVMLGVLGATLLFADLWHEPRPAQENRAAGALSCGLKSASDALAPIENTDAIVMTEVFFAPIVLYLSPRLRTVAEPNHRNTRGIRDVLAFFDARNDDDARTILDKRGIKFVMICDAGEKRRADAFGDRLLHATPSWLEEVGSNHAAPGFRLYRVRSGNG